MSELKKNVLLNDTDAYEEEQRKLDALRDEAERELSESLEHVGHEIEMSAMELLDDIEEALSYDEAVHGQKTPRLRALLLCRNIAAGLAGVLFIVAICVNLYIFNALAYFFGAVAYITEVLIMTECFHRKASHDEMFMAYIFGPLYILMGINYLFK